MKRSETSREKLFREFEAYAQENYLHVDVISEGPTTAEVVIIGEGPGQTEVKKGVPFIGGAGRLLWDNLRDLGLHRANTYVTNVVKRQISLNRKGNEKHIVRRDELDKWIGLLKWELSQLPNVKYLLLLGNYAMEAILGHQGVTNWRGSVLDLHVEPFDRTIKTIVTINPAYALRELKQEPMFRMDIKKFKRVLEGTFKEYVIEALINPSYAQAIRFIRDLRRARKPVGYDIEVVNMETACHGLANDPHHGMCINLRDHVSNRYTIQQEADILLELQSMFTEFKKTGIPLIAQNGMFDSYWTWYKDYLRFWCSHDTLLAHHTLYPLWPHSLAFQTAQYTNLPFYKDEGKRWREGGDIDEYWTYNVKDACILIPIYRKQIKELDRDGLRDFFQDHVMRLQPHCIASIVHGLAVDMKAKEDAIDKSAMDLKKHENEVYRLIGEATGEQVDINLRSTPQLQTLLFKTLKLEGRGLSTDKHNRARIRKNPKTPAIAKELLVAFDRWKSEATFHSNFATSIVSNDERFRFELRQFGVSKAPGRLSSRKLLTEEGGNVQNQPPRARNMYVADEGCCFIYFDLSQAEARVVAYRANIPSWKEQFERARLEGGYDCHRALAADMWHIPYDEVPKKDYVEDEDGKIVFTKRYVAKRCRHGLNYRMEIDKLAEVTGLPYYEARIAYQLYHRLTPELRRWWKEQERVFRETKVIYNALGRRFKVIQRLDENVLESIVAFYPQSTIGDKVAQVWYQAEEDDEWPETCRIAINVHDSLTGLGPTVRYSRGVMVKKSDALKALAILKKYAEKPIMIQDVWNRKPEPLIIPAETKISTTEIRDKKTNKVIGQDEFHRWSNMIDVVV